MSRFFVLPNRRLSAVVTCRVGVRAVMRLAAMLPVLVLAGCGVGVVDTTAHVSLALNGRVHGGQQAVSGSVIQLWAAGVTGSQTPGSVALIPAGSYYPGGQSGCTSGAGVTCNSSVMTDGGGNFTITGDYTCPSANSQVYITSTGGNPGLAPGTNNSSLVMLVALGSCGNLTPTTEVYINEVTTVAAAWALAQFATSSTNIVSTPTNTAGIANAFLDAQLLADTNAGQAAFLPSNLTIETAKLYALANAIAPCVNSDGTAGCAALFSAANVTAPSDTFQAALSIVKNPGQNVQAVFNAISPQAQYVPYAFPLTQAPNDWTMSLTVTGGGLNMPTAMAIDAENNVWVTGQASPLAEFNAQGTPLSGTGFAQDSGGYVPIEQANALVVDSVGDIWICNYNSGYNGKGSVTEVMGSASGSPGTVVTGTNGHPTFYDSSIYYPSGLSADTNGDIFIANNDSSSVTVYNSSGGVVAQSLGINDNLNATPLAVAADSLHGFWLSDDDYSIAHVDQYGNLLAHVACCSESYGLATDSAGNVWVADYLGNAFSEVNSSGHAVITQSSVGGLFRPAQVVIDGAQNVWITNLYGQSITEIAGVNASTPGAAISPTNGVYGTGGYGLDAGLAQPYSIAPDTAGNLWVSNEGKAAVTMFFGLAAPTVTPVTPVPAAP